MKISKLEYDTIIKNKKLSDALGEIQEDYYQQIVKILQCGDDNGWLVDYFFNDNIDINTLIYHENIEIESE
jgi:hypothetical protein